MTTSLNTLTAVQTRHDDLITEARTIIDNSTGDLTGDDLARYEAIEAELDILTARRNRLETLERHLTAGSTATGANTPTLNVLRRTDDPYSLTDSHIGDIKGRALSAIEKTSHLEDAHKARATELVENVDLVDGRVARHIVLTGRPEYRSGWQKLVSGNDWAITNEERQAITLARASSLTAGAGGYAVPFTLDSTLILNNAGTVNPWRKVARQVSIATDDWNGVASAGVTAAWAAEAAEATDNAPTLTQPSITVQKAHAFVPFSIEVGQDWASIETDLRMAFADAKDRLEGSAFATGTGSGQPKGLITALVAASTPIQTSVTTDTFAVADVYAALEKCPARYRSTGTWVANLSIINKLRQFGTANNYSGFTVDLTAAGIPQLLGKPLYESSDLDGVINATQENYVLVFGDMSRYLIVDRLGMTVELLPHLLGSNRRPSGQRGLYAYWRVGADCTDTSAFGLLNVT